MGIMAFLAMVTPIYLLLPGTNRVFRDAENTRKHRAAAQST